MVAVGNLQHLHLPRGVGDDGGGPGEEPVHLFGGDQFVLAAREEEYVAAQAFDPLDAAPPAARSRGEGGVGGRVECCGVCVCWWVKELAA